MTRVSSALLVLLVASNAAWAYYALWNAGSAGNSVPDSTREALESPVASPPSRNPQAPAQKPPPAVLRGEQWKADIFQIEDAARRGGALSAVERAIRDTDPRVAADALRVIPAMHDVTYDRARLHDAVRSRLADSDSEVRLAAAFALIQMPRDPADTERLLDVLAEHPGDSRALFAAAWIANHRVEGRLAKFYVRALGMSHARQAQEVANDLRGMWIAPEVEQAVLAAWERAKAGDEPGLWLYILGQMRPTREARVRMIFGILAQGDSDAAQLLGDALRKDQLDAPAVPVAADLAAGTLAKAPNSEVQDLCLRVLRELGTSKEAPKIRAFAQNRLVGEAPRRRAAELARTLESRR